MANRATIGNMGPEFGSTCAIFPIDDETLALPAAAPAGPQEQVALVEAYAKEQGLWHDPAREPVLRGARARPVHRRPSIAGPKRPQDRVALRRRQDRLPRGAARLRARSDRMAAWPTRAPLGPDRQRTGAVNATRHAGRRHYDLDHGVGRDRRHHLLHQHLQPVGHDRRALLAKKAVEAGLSRKPWVKTTLAPGSKVVMDYYERAGLTALPGQARLQPGRLRLHDLHRQLRAAAEAISAAVNERRPRRRAPCCRATGTSRAGSTRTCKMNYLASPPLVVAYALAGTMDIDLVSDPLGTGTDGKPVYLRDIWPSQPRRSPRWCRERSPPRCSPATTPTSSRATTVARARGPAGDTFAWDEYSTYVRRPPYFDEMPDEPQPVTDIHGARVLAMLGDSVTTDHISPAGRSGPTARPGST